MAICANPRTNHLTHVALLGTLLFFEFVSMALAAAFIARGKSQYYGYSFESAALVLAANVLTIIATATFLVFNLVGNLYKGFKNRLMVELIVFEILWILNLAGSSYMSSDASDFDCSFKSCQLGKSTLAFSWISTVILACLQVLLFVWTCVQRKRQPEISAYKSNIKAHYVEGRMGSRGNDTIMASIATASTGTTAPPVATSQTLNPVIVAEPAKVQLAQSI